MAESFDTSDPWRSGFDAYRRERIRSIARNTTAEERLAWLEAAIEFARRAGVRPERKPMRRRPEA